MPHPARSSNLHMKSRREQGRRYRNVIERRTSRSDRNFVGLEAPDAVVGAAIPRRPLWDSYKDAAGAVSKTYGASGRYSATKSRNGCFAAPSSPIYRNAPTAFGAANVCRKELPMMDV